MWVLCQSFLLLMPLWGGRSEIAETVKDGSVALQLVKPVDFQAYWFADALGTAFYYLLMRSLPTFWLGKLIFGAVFPQQLDIGIAFAVSMLLAICLSIAITVSVRSVAFWTLDATGVKLHRAHRHHVLFRTACPYLAVARVGSAHREMVAV